MNIKELAEKVTAGHPRISSDAAVHTLRIAFELLKKEIEATPEGSVTVATFGSFRSRTVTGKDGAPSIRRVFVPSKPKGASADSPVAAEVEAEAEAAT